MPRGVNKLDTALIERRLWTPEELPNKLVWLDAADPRSIVPFTSAATRVERWRDKSGRGMDAVGTNSFYCPTYTNYALNGLTAVTFTNGDQGSLDFTSQTTIRTAVCLCRWDTAIMSPHPNYKPIIGHSSNYDFHGSLNTGVLFDTTYSSLSVRNGNKWIDGTAVTTPAYYFTDTIHVFTTTANVTASRFMDRNLGNRGFHGNYYELILLSSVITTSDRLKVEGYLAHKWGLLNKLTSNHPYILNPPVI